MLHTIVEVLGRWAYTEVVDGTLAADYDHREGVEELRKKRLDGVPYDVLNTADKDRLATLCYAVRPTVITHYAAAISRFELVRLTKDQMAAILVMPQVDWNLLKGRFPPLGEFIHSPAPEDPKDCRNVKKPVGGYVSPVDALTVGLYQQHYVLIDGYHRAVVFLRWGASNASIAAYWPRL